MIKEVLLNDSYQLFIEVLPHNNAVLIELIKDKVNVIDTVCFEYPIKKEFKNDLS